MLSQRIGFGGLMIAALVGLIWLDAWCGKLSDDSVIGRLVQAGPVVSLLWMVVAVFAGRELCLLFRNASIRPATGWCMQLCAALALCPIACAALGARAALDPLLSLFLLIIAVAGTFVVIANSRRHNATTSGAPVDLSGAATDMTVTMFAILYVGLLGAFIPRLRIAAGTPWILLYALMVIKSADIGAYFTGMAIGRHKLIPWLSPKKTIEGLLGGMALSAIVAIVLRIALPQVGAVLSAVPIWQLVLLGVISAVLGQTGDLLESLIKRSIGAKDSGAVVPAFGGLLDILDSPLLCMPAAYYLLLASGR